MSAEEIFSRRKLVLDAASGLLIPRWIEPSPAARNALLKLSGAPDSLAVMAESGTVRLKRNQARWQAHGIELAVTSQPGGSAVILQPTREAVLRIHLRWQLETPVKLLFLGDDWERSYGDLAWRGMEPERVMPWYFLAFDDGFTVASGVKTAAAAFCFWQVDPAGVSLWLDVRNGGRGLLLSGRELHVASIVQEFYPELKPFAAARRFCQRLAAKPRMPLAPVYGGNNWYYAYGHSSAPDILADSERMSSLASSQENRPFMVIDDGWQPNPTAGPWSHGNVRFPDMPQLAAAMRRIGVQPGLWIRPLFTRESIVSAWRLESPNAALEYKARQSYTIDPTVPEALESVRQDIRTAAAWGYRLIKHDFSTYDLLGRWGFHMGAEITDPNWSFANRTRTNAEIIRDLYEVLREAAGAALLLGCNTVGHLAAGLFELQRIGDDTSGRDWNRTRKMGVNTLAFRAPQHGAFLPSMPIVSGSPGRSLGVSILNGSICWLVAELLYLFRLRPMRSVRSNVRRFIRRSRSLPTSCLCSSRSIGCEIQSRANGCSEGKPLPTIGSAQKAYRRCKSRPKSTAALRNSR
jgi:alpha-galactosidase